MTRRIFTPLCLLMTATGLLNASSIALPTINSPFAGYGYLGMVVGPLSTDDNLASGSANYDLLTGTNFSAPGALPAAIGNAYSSADAETSIWQLDASGNLSVVWVNSNGAALPAIIFYLPGSDAVGITGDLTALNSSVPGAGQISLKYKPSGMTGYIEAFQTSNSADLGSISDQSTNNVNHRLGLTSVAANRLLVNGSAPEPASLVLIVAGVGLLGFARKRIRHAA
jgi:hypothetical protein